MSLVCSALTWPMWCRAVLTAPLHGSAFWLSQFRQQLAATMGCSASLIWLFGAGRMGLYRLAQSMQIQPDEHVILPAYTCVVVPNALHFAGAAIRYIDIEAQTLDYCWPDVEAACNAQTRLLILPANFGLQGDLAACKQRLNLLKQRWPQLVIVADMAHALSRNAPKDLGAITDAAFYSFEFSKCLTTGMGGALRINDTALAARYRDFEASTTRLVTPSWLLVWRQMATIKTHLVTASGWPTLGRWSQGLLRRMKLLYATPSDELAGRLPAGYPIAMSGFGARLGLLQLAGYADTETLRKQQAAMYIDLLAEHPAVVLPAGVERDSLLRFPLMISAKAEAAGWDRQRFITHIKAKTGITLGSWFNDVIHPAGSYRHGYESGSCPNGELVARRMVNLPLGRHVKLTPARLATLKEALDEVVA